MQRQILGEKLCQAARRRVTMCAGSVIFSLEVAVPCDCQATASTDYTDRTERIKDDQRTESQGHGAGA